MAAAQRFNGTKETDVLIVAERQSFMTSAISSALLAEGVEPAFSLPDIRKTGGKEPPPPVTLLYIQDSGAQMRKYATYLKDRVGDGDWETGICLAGDGEDIEAAKSLIAGARITASFLRPINVKKLASELSGTVEKARREAAKKRVLVVDDQASELRRYKMLLENRYRVFIANSGMTALTVLARHRIDMVLLDYDMPVASGPQVLKMIRSEPETARIPVAFLTSRADAGTVMEAVKLRPAKYLLKSMPPGDILAGIEDVIGT